MTKEAEASAPPPTDPAALAGVQAPIDPTPPTEPAAVAGQEAQKAGRGGIAIAGAKLYFMVTGLVQQIALGNILVGGGYGALSTVMGIASITYNPLVQTGIQGVSRPVAPTPLEERPAVMRTALKVHFGIGLLVAVLFVLAAPILADATNAPYLTNTFRLFGGVLLAYAFYGPLVGILNGQQRFTWQAGLDVVAATLRTGFMVGGAWWLARTRDAGDQGAAIGFGASAATMFLIAAVITGFGRAGATSFTAKKHLGFIAPLVLGQFILNLLFQADLQLLGRFARDAAVAAGLGAQAADPWWARTVPRSCSPSCRISCSSPSASCCFRCLPGRRTKATPRACEST